MMTPTASPLSPSLPRRVFGAQPLHTDGDLAALAFAAGGRVADCPPPAWVDALAFNPAGTLLATGDDAGVIRLWERASRRPARELRGHDSGVSALAFSAEGKLLASAGEDKVIRLWDVARGEPAGTLEGHTDRVP